MYEFAVTPAVTQLRRPGVIITEVVPGSVGYLLELQPNDRIVKVNGRSVRDYLDFRFQTSGETELTFLVKKRTAILKRSNLTARKARTSALRSSRSYPVNVRTNVCSASAKAILRTRGPRCLFVTRIFAFRSFTEITPRSRQSLMTR